MMKKLRNIFLKKKGDIAIWGWWQGKNLGDNWIKEVMAKSFEDAIFIDTNTSIKNFRNYKFIICGGGGLFVRDVHDVWKRKSPVPFGVIGLGAEFRHKNQNAFILSKNAEFFFVRDQNSVDCMNLNEKNRSYDMTFFDPLPVSAKYNLDSVLFIWRPPSALLHYDDFKRYIGKVTEEKRWFEILKSKFNTIYRDNFITKKNNINDLTDNVGFIISARYHGILAAIQRGIPCIGIDLCPKIRSLLKESGLEEFCLKLNEVDKLEEKIKKCLEDSERIREKQLDFVAIATAKVKEDVEFAMSRIKKVVQSNS